MINTTIGSEKPGLKEIIIDVEKRLNKEELCWVAFYPENPGFKGYGQSVTEAVGMLVSGMFKYRFTELASAKFEGFGWGLEKLKMHLQEIVEKNPESIYIAEIIINELEEIKQSFLDSKCPIAPVLDAEKKLKALLDGESSR